MKCVIGVTFFAEIHEFCIVFIACTHTCTPENIYLQMLVRKWSHWLFRCKHFVFEALYRMIIQRLVILGVQFVYIVYFYKTFHWLMIYILCWMFSQNLPSTGFNYIQNNKTFTFGKFSILWKSSPIFFWYWIVFSLTCLMVFVWNRAICMSLMCCFGFEMFFMQTGQFCDSWHICVNYSSIAYDIYSLLVNILYWVDLRFVPMLANSSWHSSNWWITLKQLSWNICQPFAFSFHFVFLPLEII